jgi:hypothetical protein
MEDLRKQMLQKLKDSIHVPDNDDDSDDNYETQTVNNDDIFELNDNSHKQSVENNNDDLFNKCLSKFKRENPSVPRNKAPSILKNILQEIYKTHDNPERVFLTMKK